jgi:hypothetical protein
VLLLIFAIVPTFQKGKKQKGIIMMNIFEAKNHLEFIFSALVEDKAKIPRGKIAQVAKYLRCHPSYFSQILRSKSFLNHEQAIQLCQFFAMNEEESEFFINLLDRDRAGSLQVKAHFDRLLARKLKERYSLQKREPLMGKLSSEDEALFVQSINHALVHAALHLPEMYQKKQLSRFLRLPEAEVLRSLNLLKRVEVADCLKQKWRATKTNFTIGRENPLGNLAHIHWRLKTIHQLQEGRRTEDHTHISSVYCIAKKDVENIRNLLLNNLVKVRREMVNSVSERMFALCLDFYPLE